ncbi:YqgQ family protein [Jeotgalibacillus sp. ET6]|uniref:YqgQ family protein n=1 Tax=Jeotgalibacillus sp. ET6 TaxID=3037260 RepID=UPI002418537D|nr:YqgQ family protein [Jeotgalibacillus sp. ET6]MDG5470805.1 YqgQ family protein [Jeotgalibacillus sp. ET6]
MATIWDVQQLLKRFGIFVYIGDRKTNLEMMEVEIKELYHSQLIDIQDFQKAVLLLRNEIQLENKSGRTGDR